MLRALVIDESTLSMGSAAHTAAMMTQGTLEPSFAAPTFTKTNMNGASLDSLLPTTTATLQLLCACIEAYPRGECWASSARAGWSTVLDERLYPAVRVLERHGSSPVDAAAVVYLLGSTLETHGGSGGEEDVQLWTLVALLKMTEASAVICSREGLLPEDAASFGLASSLQALRVAWQYVWGVLFRYDLRYSSYTSGAFGNNSGELVLQLLTQILRCQCVDRMCLFICKEPTTIGTSGLSLENVRNTQSALSQSPFIQGEQGQQLWKLPVFEDASSILSPAPFELITSVIQHNGFIDTSDAAALASTASVQMSNVKDRLWFVKLCLCFIQLSMEDTVESQIRRTFIPFAATCLASLISNGQIASNLSTFELDGLTRFATTEDVEPIFIYYNPDDGGIASKKSIYSLYTALWEESITPSDHISTPDQGLALRIAQGRGALLSRYLNAEYERSQLRWFMKQERASCTDSGFSSQRLPLGNMVIEKIKSSCFNELLFQLKYENANTGDDAEGDFAAHDDIKSSALPKLTSCLSLILTVLMSQHSSAKELSDGVVHIFADTFAPSFDLVAENMIHLTIYPSDILAVFCHLSGIIRCLTCIAAFGGGGTAIPRLFSNQARSLFTLCKLLLKEYRNEVCTSGASDEMAASRQDFDSDSDIDHVIARRAQIQQARTHQTSNFSDESDGLMDDDENDENRDYRPRKDRALNPKRRKMRHGPRPKVNKDSTKGNALIKKSIDSKGAWACASFMLVLQPSFKCLELISSHLVWPEDNNNQAGYGTVSKTSDPFGALVCAALFCQKSVILRRDRLDLRCGRADEEDEDKESALILFIEVILQSRRVHSPSSKYFMYGLNLIADIVKILECGESSGPIGVSESKVVIEALYPERVGKESEDYFLLRQWKRTLRYHSSYRSQQIHAATLSFLYSKKNLRKEFDSLFGPMMFSSFRHIDEKVRSLASDVLGVALLSFSDQKSLATDVLKNALPINRLDNKKKFDKWVLSLSDPKIQDDLAMLEERALMDTSVSIQYHSIECVGLVAGITTNKILGREMVWKLVDLAAKNTSLSLLCHRALKRTSLLLGFKSTSQMFDDIMPHILVKWLDSHRSLQDFPLLLMSPFVIGRACCFLPNELMSILLKGGGCANDVLSIDAMEGEAQTLNDRLLTSFVISVAKFLIPNILYSAADVDPTTRNDSDEGKIADASQYLSECVTILTGVDSDENKAKVLCNHIADLYAFVAVLAENENATQGCENAFQFLKRCVSSVHIERRGAKQRSDTLRHIILLHQKGISVLVGLDHIELTSSSYIEGMKYVSKQLKAPSSNHNHGSFLQQLGASMTECVVLVKYWLSMSLSEKQKEDSWGSFMLLCEILKEHIQHGTIKPGECGFFLHCFIVIMLSPNNVGICPLVLETLKSVLGIFFSKEALVDSADAILHKLSLALLQIHQRAFQTFSTTVCQTLSCMEYEQKSSQGLAGFEEDETSWDSLGEAPWESSSESDEALKHLIGTKAIFDEKVSSDTMLFAYECLDIIVNSGKVQMESEVVVGLQHPKEQVFRNVNEKYSLLSLFNSTQQISTIETDLENECEHFIHIMNEHPISSDDFDSITSNSSHDVLARLLALRRLEKVLLAQGNLLNNKCYSDIYPFLLRICHSRDPEESRLVSSRCLGELIDAPSQKPRHEQESIEVKDSLDDPMSSIKRTVLTMLGQYLLSECAATSLVAMKTAKALFVTPAGKECWQSLDGDIKSLLSPFNTAEDGKLRREAIRVSNNCLERLKAISGSSDSDSWCWNDKLWTCFDSEDRSCDLWIRNITCSIISCCFGKGSNVGKGDQDDFFWICQGLCAKESNFAASIFPALIFYLLDSEAREKCQESNIIQDTNNAIGSPASAMNKKISHSFSLILNPKSNIHISPQAITLVLNTLELLRAVTEHRFLTSTDHAKNKSMAQKHISSSSKKRKSPDTDSFAASPKWRGFPYGVVLRVSGLDIAKACLKVKRYYSALYYAEMAMQNLIGSGTFFEDVANDSSVRQDAATVLDISGFGVLSQRGQGDETVLENALIAQDVIGCCLSELTAHDELQGVLAKGSVLKLKQNITSLNTLEGCRRDQTLSMLMDLDNGLQSTPEVGRANGISLGFPNIASCLERLGLNHIKHNYLAGIEKYMDKEKNADNEKCYLREKWFQDSLNKVSDWGDSSFPRLNEGESQTLAQGTMRHSSEKPISFASQPLGKFHESVYEALQKIAKNDTIGGSVHILQARKSVLADMEYLVGSEGQSAGMLEHLIKLKVLGQLEAVTKTLEKKSSIASLLNRWGFLDNASETLETILMDNNIHSGTKEQRADIDEALFSSIHTAFSVKEIALKILRNMFSSSQQGIHTMNALASHFYNSCSVYRELGYPDAAKVSLSNLRQVLKSELGDHSTGNLALMLRLEDAKIMKSQGNLDDAITYCRLIASHLNGGTSDSVDIKRDQICADALLLGGLWMAEHNVDAAESILSSYFEKASELAMQIHKKSPSDSSVYRASLASFNLGEFAANLFNSVDARVKSDAFKRRIVVSIERKKELQALTDQLTKLQKKPRASNEAAIHEARIIHITLSREIEMEDRELSSIETSTQRYLHLAMESYCTALKLCPATVTANVPKHVFQLISLWFKNCQKKNTNQLLKLHLPQIPSYRFVPLTYQLFSRIDKTQDDNHTGFQNTLREMVLKICSEHPYHGLVQLLALSNGKRVGDGVNNRHANVYLENIGTSKVDAVNDICQELRKHSPEYVSALMDSYETLMNSYMSLAEYDTSSITRKKIDKRLSFKQYKLDLDCCLSGGRSRGKRSATTTNMPAIITKPPAIRPDANYGNGTEDPIGTERVHGFEATFDLTPTGLHRPKIVKCIGSRGTRFKQLVKGGDDLRQDAIMQQVFDTVNNLLRHEGQNTNGFIKKSFGSSLSTVATRQLRLITYGITPLSPASGVLEWVDNTMCFGDFLTDRGKHVGAHSKYFPGEWGNNDVREYYRNAADKRNATRESKLKAFEKICANFSPAFRFFFLEYFKSSMEAWHTARTLYTKSCAVNSIVGHVLGIGDRHTSNILVHTKTGEVVQIDFGIVFEQGKTLQTPELVPFRLTRDVVDGMGPSGTDGVFSKAAEATMGVLRKNADTLLTILSAVVSDPLYKWSLSPLKANQHQQNNDDGNSRKTFPSVLMSSNEDENRNDAADQAIAKIHEKLEGYEDGTSGEHKTVAGQVKLLINEARDPGNLSVMFAGWAPWM